MPIQYTCFGRPVRLHMPPRRYQVLFTGILFLSITLFLFGPPSTADLPTYDTIADAVKNPQLPNLQLPELPELPNLPQPFGPPTHDAPAEQNSNSTGAYRLINYIQNYKWHNPFSKDVADENTTVLPPLMERPSIYTFFEPRKKQSKELAEAENRLILAWRRAWWAQGFKPQVLSRAEAMRHPQYEIVQRLKLDKIDEEVETEVMRWLAWGHMGGGVLAHWLALPMAEYDNPILSLLRKKDFPNLSRVDGLQNALFFGGADAVTEAIKKAVGSELFKNVTESRAKIISLKEDAGAMVNLLGKDVKRESKSHGIAYYSNTTIADTYKPISDKLRDTTEVEGLELLAQLINSHLHLTFQSIYSEGVAVVKPLPEHTTALMYEAIDIARNLTQCPTSPLPGTCPPNRPKCSPCDPSKPPKLQLLPALKKSPAIYTVGNVPHPYTLVSLHYTKDVIEASFLRKGTERNLWVKALTKEVLDEDKTEADRVLHFKDTVASPLTAASSLWLTAERLDQVDLDWIFGFNLPQMASPGEKPEPLNEGSDIMLSPRPAPPAPIEGVEVPEEKFIKKEEERLKKARDALKSTSRHLEPVINNVEQWSPVDTEAWQFARAFSARRTKERETWEKEEKKFAGSEHKAGVHHGGGGDRWAD
ncbi:hypothetical protein M011DRAFT_469070 [Sporormia fimetaria CBS 119925]|uniref:Uncharacterized protein n=1 Tax=Sporormia fimetaria CBS 119925 TaxID=1340428 RepID=A0A6A6V583_9PLEO|nr:hypothetical protein M011DRAFT_469070 [Sporormia fimetaria CBS 119925]